ncbi:phosphoribosylglycinamide formyltransferase [Labilibaculum antarcticum]|uniref:Phosphoribosylglycinamide formyltransferase n=1 Tax=Labilibaculum antarcticum TaxID=1717717 RepID=A0A1Y1CKI5_9BACT|nr:phosphoribosylglycinamide formyltransferase [Labilibaculum antarcticum]BAX80573.1 phosphoribosylglycinamide formyltransferase [Labilibaculum antarcticum]
MKRLAIFASGSGSNAENIARYFSDKPEFEISAILSNNANAFVLSRARSLNIPTLVFSRSEFNKTDKIVSFLAEKKVDFIVLAGFIWLLPLNLLRKYPDSIVNIHPALLPKYGGKGMYGMNVHKAVVENKEKESGITIHMINEKYDEGRIIYQAKCSIAPNDTPEDVAEKIHKLEYEFFPKIIEQLL